MAKNVFSGFRSARVHPSESSRARRRVTTWAALGVLALLATLLTPLSTATAQSASPPDAPVVTATALDGSVLLTWTTDDATTTSDTTGVAGGGFDNGSTVLRWEYQTVGSGVWLPIPGSNRHTEDYTVTGLRNGTPYRFLVRAINGAGNGTPSATPAEADAVTPTTTPQAPRSLSAVPANSRVHLFWTQVSSTAADLTTPAQEAPSVFNGYSDILRYEIRQKTGDGDYSPWSIIIGSDQTTGRGAGSDGSLNTSDDVPAHTVDGLTNGVTYQFQVRAVNGNGPGAASETNPITLATTPGRPRSLTATPGNAQVALSWTASSNGGLPITSWQFRLIPADGVTAFSAPAVDPPTPAWVTIPGSDADTTGYTVLSLDNAVTYTFQVRAVNALGGGSTAESEPVSPGAPPGAPTGLMGTADESSVTLTWTPPLVDENDPPTPADPSDDSLNDGDSTLLRYEYSQSANGGEYGEWTEIPGRALFESPIADPASPVRATVATRTGAVTHTVRNLTAGTAYSFRVRAVNAAGAGPHADISAPVYPGTTPSAPGNLRATTAYQAASGQAMITLSWNPASDGGSPVTQWEYKVGTSLTALSAATSTTWTTICHNNPPAAPDPNCASTSSVTIPRPDPDGPTGPRTAPDLNVDINGDGTVDDLTANPELRWPVAGGTYYFVVRATNARTNNNHLSSGVARATFSQSVPSAPRAVNIRTTSAGTTAGTASVTLVWSASVTGGSAITDYEYSTKAGDGAWGPWTSAGLSTSTPADADGDTVELVAGLNPGTVYQFRVRARNDIGAGSHTESPAIVPGAPGTPGAGSDVVGCPRLFATPGTTEVTLSFTGSDDSTPCTTGNIGTSGATNTKWQYSYKVGDGDYSGWLFAGADSTDGDFDPSDINPSSTTANAIDGLENGVAHTFRIRAVNPGGLSSPILTSNTVTPGVNPPAPQGLSAAAGDQQITLSWTSGGSGGPAITRWQLCGGVTAQVDVTTGGTGTGSIKCGPAGAGWGPISGSGADTTSHTITRTDPADPTTALQNGTSYTYLVRAVNAIPGFGARAQANAATPGRAPTAPARALVDAGDGEVTIQVDPPARNNGSPVVGYQVRKSENGGAYDAWESLGTTVRPGTGQNPSAQTGAKVTGLTNGVSYTFEVRAVNGFGPGASTATDAITPTGAPTANMLAADPGDGQVALSWNQLSSGGSTIVKWQYRMSESGGGYGAWMDIADSGPSTTSHTVTGLDNGTSYSFEVRGVNVNLEMVNAAPITSAAVTPGTVPAAPSVSAARGNGQVDLSWTAGTAAGAAATTGWQVRTDDGEWMDAGGADASSYSVTGLMNGTSYTFEVRAVNSFGAGEAGSASATPATTPSAPDVSAMRGDGSTAVSWTAGDDGGSAVTGWQVQVNDGGWTDVAADTMSLSVDTDDGTAYTIMVRGVNDVGEGASGSASVEAGSTPAAPTVTATGGNGSITVSWTAGDDGGSSVSAWHYRKKVSIGDYGDWMEASADTMSVTVSELGSGTGVLSYTFQVRGVNGVGEGEAGTSNEASPVAAPPANGMFYSGVVTGPDFCANMSLGGARLFAHDSDGDGVADVCSLPYTRREAIARQNAVEALSVQHASEFARLVNAACAITEGDGDCGGDMTAAPPAVPINDGGPFYSGIITGPSFCANRSLGGPTTYPHDSDGDGVADVCALPYTRREAIARQLAGDILAASNTADFARELASACRGLTGADYGDDPADLANDACA